MDECGVDSPPKKRRTNFVAGMVAEVLVVWHCLLSLLQSWQECRRVQQALVVGVFHIRQPQTGQTRNMTATPICRSRTESCVPRLPLQTRCNLWRISGTLPEEVELTISNKNIGEINLDVSCAPCGSLVFIPQERQQPYPLPVPGGNHVHNFLWRYFDQMSPRPHCPSVFVIPHLPRYLLWPSCTATACSHTPPALLFSRCLGGLVFSGAPCLGCRCHRRSLVVDGRR